MTPRLGDATSCVGALLGRQGMSPHLPYAATQLDEVEIGIEKCSLQSCSFLGETFDGRRETKAERVGEGGGGARWSNGGGQQERRGHERRRLESSRYGGNANQVGSAGIEDLIWLDFFSGK